MKSYKLKINGNPYDVQIKEAKDNIISVEVNGSSYHIELEKEVKATKTPVLVRSGTRPTQVEVPITTKAVPKKIVSPLPGTIIKIRVNVGDTVKTGDPLIILEAMKMENTILAESSGKVIAINTREGSSVLQGDVLIEIG
ncbi:MAG: biotin/lipoyl-binding protein [Cyclobacteriaceae bacterium]|jgi:biotin carboxyl carrier protein|nr:biotin/lipoyl-binding protein [Cyclobacteriaceae bacterium]